jgi:Flp pilus assembly protein TadD
MAGMLDALTGETVPAEGAGRVESTDPATTCLREAASLLEERRGVEAEHLLRKALRLRPDDPDVLNDLGTALWHQGRVSEAEPLFVRANAISPSDARIWNNLGITCWDQGRLDEAVACYERSLQLERDQFDPTMNLGVALSQLGRVEEALGYLRAALRMRPHSADALLNLGMTLGRMGDWTGALDYYEQSLKWQPDYAEVHRNRAYAWLYQGDYERGWPEHEWRLKCRRHPGFVIDRPRWNGEQLQGRIILLHYEQGLGDTLQFMRFAPLVKQCGGQVLMLCPTSLIRLAAQCPGVDLAFDGTSYQPGCHCQAPLSSLPAIFRTTLDTLPAHVPYLRVDPTVVERWRLQLAGALAEDAPSGEAGAATLRRADSPARPFLIGIAWQGKSTHPFDRFRSFALAQLAPVAELAGVRLISLQAEDGLDQLRTCAGRFPVINLKSRRPRDFLDTAAIIRLLDLVIAPDSAVAHLAGALGARVWAALSTVPEWRWMADREDTPWYPTMRLFRQKSLGDWDGVFLSMAEVLKTELAARPVPPRQVA